MLTDIAPLAALRNLTHLAFWECEKIQDIQPLAWLPNLVELALVQCGKTTNFYPISGHKKLNTLRLTIPHNNLSFLRDLKQLKELVFYNCPKLDNLALLSHLQKLEVLGFYECRLVTETMLDELEKKLPKNCYVY